MSEQGGPDLARRPPDGNQATAKSTTFRENLATVNHMIGVTGALIAVFGAITSVLFSISQYNKTCTAKGYTPYACFGGYIGLIEMEHLDRIQQENQESRAALATRSTEIAELRGKGTAMASQARETEATLMAVRADLGGATTKIGELQDALRQRDVKISELQKRAQGSAPPPPQSSQEVPPRPPSRPTPYVIAAAIWPEGSIPAGTEVSKDTPHGTVVCVGGNLNTGMTRRCRWK